MTMHGGGKLKRPFDDRLLGPRAHHVGGGPLAEQQGQGIDDHRFPGARLPGEDVEARLEWKGDVGDDGEIADALLCQHLRSHPDAQVAPVQLAPQALEEALQAEPDQQDGTLRATHLEALARLNRRAHLPIEGDEHFVAPRRNRLDRDDGGGRQDERAHRERVRADGGDDDRIDGRHDDRSSRGHRVRGRTRGRADDDAVRRILRDLVTIDGHFETDDARQATFVDDDIVQHEGLDSAAFGALAGNCCLEREPRLGRVRAAHDGVEHKIKGVGCRGREKAYTAEIESEDRGIRPIQKARTAQQCPISAERDEEVEALRRLTDRGSWGWPERPNALLGVQLEPDAGRLLLKRREESTKIRVVGVSDDPDVHRGVSDSSAARARMRAAIPAPVRPTSASCWARGACSYVRSGTPSATTRESGAVVCTSAASAAPKPFTTVPSSTVTRSL